MTEEALTTAEHTEAHGDKIKTYRKLNDTQVAMINRVKELEQHIAEELAAVRLTVNANPRDLAIARTALEDGCIRLTRAIAQPFSPFD